MLLFQMFKNITEIVKAYKEGYSQHMIAKVLELNQVTVQRISKRIADSISITWTPLSLLKGAVKTVELGK